MDEINLIMGALSAGLEEASKATASQAVKDSYNFLKNSIKKKLEGISDKKPPNDPAKTLESFEEDPQSNEKSLLKELTEAGVEKEKEIFQAAEDLMELIKQSQGKVKITQSINVTGPVDSIQNIGNVYKDVNIGIKRHNDS